MVTIATFNEQPKAKHLKERLQAAGLKADLINEGHLQKAVFMSKPQANVKVMVDEKDFSKAQELLVQWEASDPEIGSAIKCPQCGSSRIEYPQMTRKFLTPAVTSVLFALKIFPKEFYCEVCHFTWNNEGDNARYRLWRHFFPGAETEKGR